MIHLHQLLKVEQGRLSTGDDVALDIRREEREPQDPSIGLCQTKCTGW